MSSSERVFLSMRIHKHDAHAAEHVPRVDFPGTPHARAGSSMRTCTFGGGSHPKHVQAAACVRTHVMVDLDAHRRAASTNLRLESRMRA